MNKSWSGLHKIYKKQDWIHKPSIFAEQAISYFPKTGKVLDLGAGHGQDSIFFSSEGYEVISTDIETTSLAENITATSENIKNNISVVTLDLAHPIKLADESFDVVYAHLSLHYFDRDMTIRLFNDIHNILKPGGVLAFLTNSTADPEYNTGVKLEEDYYKIEGRPKRYFNIKTAEEFTKKFAPLLVDDAGETYKDAAKGIHNLIRFIGVKT